MITQIEGIPHNTNNITITANETTDTLVLQKENEKNVIEDKPEEIPSFSEWAQKRLEEAEKNEQINSSKTLASNGK